MFRKHCAVAVIAAFFVAGPGHLTVTASAQTISRAVVPMAGSSALGIGAGLANPGSTGTGLTLLPLSGMPLLGSAHALSAPTAAPAAPSPQAALLPVVSALTPAFRGAAANRGAELVAPALAALPLRAAAKAPLAPQAKNSPFAVIASVDPAVEVAQKAAALDTVFDGLEVAPKGKANDGPLVSASAPGRDVGVRLEGRSTPAESFTARPAVETTRGVSAQAERGEAAAGLRSLAQRSVAPAFAAVAFGVALWLPPLIAGSILTIGALSLLELFHPAQQREMSARFAALSIGTMAAAAVAAVHGVVGAPLLLFSAGIFGALVSFLHKKRADRALGGRSSVDQATKDGS